MDYGRERITLFEIDQPICPLVYGEAPCEASLGVTGEAKCFNTRVTCQDTTNYREVTGSPDTPSVFVMRFSFDQDSILQYGPVITSLESVDVTPGSVNLAAMNEDASALGEREQATIILKDHQHSDVGYDPYRLERITGAASVLAAGTAQSATANTIVLAADSPDEIKQGMLCVLDDGRSETILSYDAPATTVTIEGAWQQNLVLHSNDFSNITGVPSVSKGWYTTAGAHVTVAGDTVAAPDESVTAATITATAGNNAHQLISITALGGGNPDPFVSGDVVKNTIFIKEGTAPFAYIKSTNTAQERRLWFNFSTGLIGGTLNLVSSAVTALSDGWYQIDWTVTGLLRYDFCVGPALADNTTAFNAAGTETIHVWRAHHRLNTASDDYIETTAAVIDFPSA